MCCCVWLNRYWGIATVPGSLKFLVSTDLRQPGWPDPPPSLRRWLYPGILHLHYVAGYTQSPPLPLRTDPQLSHWRQVYCIVCCFVATQLARPLQQERTQVVCSNREARKRPARTWGTPVMDSWPWKQVLHINICCFLYTFFLFLSVQFSSILIYF